MKTKVTEIVAEILELETDAITETALIIDDLGADSIAVMEIVMELESEYDFEVPTEDAINLKTVADIVTYIEQKQA